MQHWTLVYEYDARGNILAQKWYDYTEGELGEPNDVYTYTYASGWNDLLTNFNGETIAYDEIGNPIQYKRDTLTWTEGADYRLFRILRRVAGLQNGS